MDIKELLQLYTSHPNVVTLNHLIQQGADRNIRMKGLNGSAAAMTVASLFAQGAGNFICLLNDLEEAGYFYNDVKQLLGEEVVNFFPSAYRRDIKYGHVDAANEILRTEALSLLQQPSARFVLVSYPEAIAEKVATQETVKEYTTYRRE